MHPNPFSPSFGIHPDLFFGRKEHLEKYAAALDTPNSADRCFFLTGTRGCGKTSLLHQYALQATRKRWDVIEAASSDVLAQLLHYVGLDKETTKSRLLSPSLSIGGVVDLALGSAATAEVEKRAQSLLTPELCGKLGSLKLKRGLAVIVDESQKIARDDIVKIGNAVQQARVEGLGISLVLGGLPSSYSKIRGYRDCTFLRRMRREMLWCMKKSETVELIKSMFAKVPEIKLSDEAVYDIGRFTGGHPYLIQLVGDEIYAAVKHAYDPSAGMTVEPEAALMESAKLKALLPYKENVLDDALSGAHESTRDYVRTALELRDETGLIKVAAINARFGESSAQMNSRRAYALNTQVLRKAGHGLLRFALPHFEYAYQEVECDDSTPEDDEWVF